MQRSYDGKQIFMIYTLRR